MHNTMQMNSGAVHSEVRVWLRLEGIAAFLLAIALFAHEGGSWLVFAALFFVPDVSFAGYLAGPRVGAAIYNIAHSYVGPLILATTMLSVRAEIPHCFGDTHLGRIGRGARQVGP